MIVSLKAEYDALVARRRGQRTGYLREKHGSWLLTYRLYDTFGRARRETVTIGPAAGPESYSRRQAERIAWDHYLSRVDELAKRPRAAMTLAQFWEATFEPGMAVRLRKSTHSQYSSLWARWIKPLLGGRALATITPGQVEAVMREVITSGRSTATARHVRKVLAAIFTRATRLQVTSGINPATAIEAPQPRPVRPAFALSASQCRQLLAVLQEPYRTMVELAILTSMNSAEIFGLQWQHVNLDPEGRILGTEVIPGRCIAVRDHYAAGERGGLKTPARRRNIPIAGSLAASLRNHLERSSLRNHLDRSKWTAPEAPVFASRAGTPFNANNIQKRILRTAGAQIGLTGCCLGWHTLRHTHATLTQAAGLSAHDRMALTGHASLAMLEHYTHGDLARLRSGVEAVAVAIGIAESKPVGGVM